MRKTQVFGLSGLLFLLFASLLPLAEGNTAGPEPNVSALTIVAQSCADPADNCKSPVKFLGERDGCACFTCEYGKPTQRIICTANGADKLKLMTLAKTR
jgi:hypothetical protein